MKSVQDSTGVIRTSTGVIDFAHYDRLAHAMRAAAVTTVVSGLGSWLRDAIGILSWAPCNKT